MRRTRGDMGRFLRRAVAAWAALLFLVDVPVGPILGVAGFADAGL